MVLDRRGVAAIEFGMIAPTFILLMLAIFVYGLYFTMQIGVTIAASEGARATVGALASDSPSTIASNAACTVLNAYSPLMTCTGATVTPHVSGTSVSLTVSYPLPTGGVFALIPFQVSNPSATAIVTYSAY
jgi:Flp pilus assembly protein TadG